MSNHVSFSDVFQSEKSVKREATPLSTTPAAKRSKPPQEPVPEVVTYSDPSSVILECGKRVRILDPEGALEFFVPQIAAWEPPATSKGFPLGLGRTPLGPQERKDLDDKIKQVRVHTPSWGENCHCLPGGEVIFQYTPFFF